MLANHAPQISLVVLETSQTLGNKSNNNQHRIFLAIFQIICFYKMFSFKVITLLQKLNLVVKNTVTKPHRELADVLIYALKRFLHVFDALMSSV
jgi:hypothetical protein